MATKINKYWKYDSQQELIDEVKHNEDVEFFLHGIRYCMGPAYQKLRVLGVCPDGDDFEFSSVEDQLNHLIDGRPLKDWWAEMELIN